MYAQVIVGLPVEGPFDYSLPKQFEKNIKPGARVAVSFRNKKEVGFVIGLIQETAIAKVKPILELLDEFPLLPDDLLTLSRHLARYYCCSQGEALAAMFPSVLRRGKKVEVAPFSYEQQSLLITARAAVKPLLINDPGNSSRWEAYLKAIDEAVREKKSVLFLEPDVCAVTQAYKRIKDEVNCEITLLQRDAPEELAQWLKVREPKPSVIISTRSGVFAPSPNLGLIIIDEEQSPQYKQEQLPHYHARDVACARAELTNARYILGSGAPSLESFGAYKRKQYSYIFFPPASYPAEVKVIDTANMFPAERKKGLLARYMQDAVFATLNEKGKALLFLNRKGFATFAACKNCGFSLKCSRCNSNLVFHYKENRLACHYCSFSVPVPSVCPQCNSDYIKFSGYGTEKVESELFRLFPQAKIRLLKEDEQLETPLSDIVVATQSVIKHKELKFDLIGVLSIDNSLNRVDFRAGEKTFGLLVGLCALTACKVIIQTSLKEHHCFSSIITQDLEGFYLKELQERRQLGFPPWRHFCFIKFRGKKEGGVRECCELFYNRLIEANKDPSVRIIAVNPGTPAKLRGNFHWQILASAKDPVTLSGFLKTELKKTRHSGIIVTVDMDPL